MPSCGRWPARAGGFGAGLHDVLEQGERRQLGPVQVVEDQGQGSFLARASGTTGPRRRRDRGGPRPPRATRSLEVGAVTPTRPRQPPQLGTAAADEAGQRPLRGGGEQVVEHLGEGLVRDAGVEARRAHEHRHVVVVQCAGHLGYQPGLARAGLTADEDDLPPPLGDLRPQPLERLELESAVPRAGGAAKPPAGEGGAGAARTPRVRCASLGRADHGSISDRLPSPRRGGDGRSPRR